MEVTEINVFPLKSARGFGLSAAEVRPRGLAGDRRWMVVDENHQFMTARKCPALLSILTRLDEHRLTLRARDREPLTVALATPDRRAPVVIWRDEVDACLPDPAADAWLSEVLGQACYLAYMDERAVRPLAAKHGFDDHVVSFADGMPLLLVNEASVADVSARVGRPIETLRFRPNIVIRGAEAFAEDSWREVRVGDVTFAVVSACARCVFTTLDPITGERDPAGEPLKTLSSFRRHPQKRSDVLFGANLTPLGNGVVRVGDPVTVT